MFTTAEIRDSLELKGRRIVQLTTADANRISNHSQLCKDIDKLESVQSADQIERQLGTPGIQFEGNLLGIEGDAGQLIAVVATVPMPGTDTFYISTDISVVPEYRKGRLEATLLEYAVANAHEWATRNQARVQIQAGCRDDQTNYVQLYTEAGFLPVRYFHTMERDLTSMPIEPAIAPAGFEIEAVNPDDDVHVKDLHITLIESFQDHFNPIDFTLEQTAHWIRSHELLKGFILLAYATSEDGTHVPAGSSVNRIRTAYNEQHGKKEGEVSALGVRRAYRRKGLARALLLSSLGVIKQAGMNTAELSVDSENPLGANELYASVGFKPRKTSIVYQLS